MPTNSAYLIGGLGTRTDTPSRKDRRTIRIGDMLQKANWCGYHDGTRNPRPLIWLDVERVDDNGCESAARLCYSNYPEPGVKPGRALYRVLGVRHGIKYVVAGPGLGQPA